MLLQEVGAEAVLMYLDSRTHLEGAYPALKLYRVSAGGRSNGLLDYDLGETPVASVGQGSYGWRRFHTGWG